MYMILATQYDKFDAKSLTRFQKILRDIFVKQWTHITTDKECVIYCQYLITDCCMLMPFS